MKRILPVLLFLFVFASCKKDVAEPAAKPKPEPIVIEFGFRLNDYNVVHDTLKNGDTFGTLLEKENLGTYNVHVLNEKIQDSFDVRKMRFGKPYTLLRTKDKSHRLQAFIYQPDRTSYYVVDLRDSVVAYKKVRPITLKKRTIAMGLEGSLTESLQKQKVDPGFATEIARIYAWSIDFFKLQKEDRFAISFTERYINDSIYDGVERLDAAFIEYKGKRIYAFPFQQDTTSGKIDYYDEDGKVLKNMFLKAPLKFIHITSRFSRNRFHPVQQIWKAHNGTDYAAPTGTPIMTTAAGTVERTGYTAGNGNFVKVRHNGTYATQYLHMSKILVRQGQRVGQGDVIGRVGSTGLATGPHVCYRFWVNGRQVDPLSLKLPNSEPMPERFKARYMKEMAPLKKTLDSVFERKFGRN
ncbi:MULTISPECIES: peptidoglycan DD-metalloendopeptidase family protein [unclassified Flavobacterium]|uniref:M23 family metallopeptidase n=1 Tax=unclassified Flavobacterium TaxID=196869 RepID=UPI001F133E80|nr:MULTISPECIES: peptidoglycan DD-metalloendopeptidase family protein [unclassified Flavobacterium]UMY66431.1 peptidoglycan DD-metalloendopeptidase family protein [Flavobacterium sp. HJ-32-4]